MASIEVKVPDIGDFDEVSVIELLVKPGDTIKQTQSAVVLEKLIGQFMFSKAAEGTK